MRGKIFFLLAALSLASIVFLPGAREARGAGCEDFVPQGCTRVKAGDKIDSVIKNKCYVFDENSTGTYVFDKINVLDGGRIYFVDPGKGKTIDFRVTAMLVERGGSSRRAPPTCPIGKQGGKLEIGLWGDDPTAQGTKTPPPNQAGIQCMTNPAGGADPKHDLRCFPSNDYAQGHYCTKDGDDPCSDPTPPAVEPKNKLLEPYGKLNFDDNPWGYKVIGVAYGGTLALYGYKGAKGLEDLNWAATHDPPDHCKVPDPAKSTLDVTELLEWANLSGTSWARLTGVHDDPNTGWTTLTLDRVVATQETGDKPNLGWSVGDQIVIGATDWYPNHSEIRTIHNVIASPTGTQLQVDRLSYPHNTQMFTTGPQSDFTNPVNRSAVDMRAVVGLLSRSITIYSLDKTPTPFPKTRDCTAGVNPNPDCYFGGHVIVRQGFKQFAIQGVEFKQLGQGGRMGHYPVHFHLAKSTNYTGDPKVQRAFVKDSSVWECGGEPPPAARVVPPILDGSIHAPPSTTADSPAGSDTYMPVMFWMMNAYNEFVGNAAVSVHGFGSCYWLLGAEVSGPSRNHSFDGFAGYNTGGVQAPLLRFRGNSCTTAPLALPAVREIAPAGNFGQAQSTGFTPLANPYLTNGSNLAENYARPIVTGNYLPGVNANLGSCLPHNQNVEELNKNPKTCVMTVIDRFSTSFNWAEVNFSSIWLRPNHYLFANSAVTDQLFGGLGIVTGGDWQQALPAYLALALNNLFVGTTQPQDETNLYARRSGPRFTVSASENLAAYGMCPPGKITCMFPAAGTGFWRGSFQPKRLITIYDGPSYADGNTFLNVGAWECDAQPCRGATSASGCKTFKNGEAELPCGIYSSTTQPVGPSGGTNLAVIDAAIGWKQPNGFYYPPAFDYRRNSFLKNRSDTLNMCLTRAPGDYQDLRFQPGSCRHNVIDRTQVYQTGNMEALNATVLAQYSGPKNGLDAGTIDFATILLDLDGSLTGSTSTIDGRPSPGLTTSVSRNIFYDAPSQTPECLSYGVQTSPYTFVSTVMGELANPPSTEDNWIPQGGGAWPPTPAVAIYRQWKLKEDVEREQSEPCGQVCNGDQYGCARASFMGMASVYQPSYLTMTVPPGLSDSQTGGLYYIDTNSGNQQVSCVKGSASLQPARFQGGRSYVLYNLFPQRDSKSSYQLYVGDVKDLKDIEFRWVRVTVHETRGELQKVIQPCDPRQPNQWCSSVVPPKPVNGVLIVTIDHKKLLEDDAFLASSRPDYDRCMPRDICYFDQSANKCRRCDPQAPEGAPNKCLRSGDFLPVDIQSMNATDKYNRKPLDAVCEEWASKASSQVQINNGAKVTSADCPAGGCLGFAFKLPQGFQPQFYNIVNNPPSGKSPSRCFVESAWMKNMLNQTSNDPQCGAPRPQSSSDFCADPKMDLPAEKDAHIDAAAPTENTGEAHVLEVAGGSDAATNAIFADDALPVRTLVAFDPGAIDLYLAHHPLTRATLRLTRTGDAGLGGRAVTLDAHPLLRDFHEGDPDDETAGRQAASTQATQVESTAPSRVLGLKPINTRGGRLPVLPGRGVAPPPPPPPGGPAPGEGPGVTWHCAWDAENGNDEHDCQVPWDTPGGDYAAPTAPTAVVEEGASTVTWDVTQDVMNGVSAWLIRLEDESQPVRVLFYSEEGAAAIGDLEAEPHLVLE